jgi:hypothetical protein
MCVSGKFSLLQSCADPRGSRLHIFGFSVNIKGISNFSGLFMTIFQVLLYHQLELFDPFDPFDSGLKGSHNCLVSNLVENAGGETFYTLAV